MAEGRNRQVRLRPFFSPGVPTRDKICVVVLGVVDNARVH